MVYILISSLFIFNTFAAKLPKFLTKQSIDSLRFVSDDGKVIYYQSKLGTLNMTKNYKNEKILDLNDDTQFQFSNTLNNKVLIEADQSFHSQMTFNKNNQIYISELGSKEAKRIATGKDPRLELDGNWISYYSPKDKSIVFHNLIIEDKVIRILLKNNKNPYFIPQHLMFTTNDVYYSDVNTDGNAAVLHYSKSDKKYLTVHKSKYPGSMIEFCKVEDNIYAFERGLFSTNNGSQIYKIPLFQNKDYRKKELIYSSTLNDIGSMICLKDRIYFVKTTQYDRYLNDKDSEVAKLTLKDNKLEILSELKEVTNICQMGNRILTQYKRDYYLIEGKNDAKDDALNAN